MTGIPVDPNHHHAQAAGRHAGCTQSADLIAGGYAVWWWTFQPERPDHARRAAAVFADRNADRRRRSQRGSAGESRGSPRQRADRVCACSALSTTWMILIVASDVVITKAGGLTVTEILARGTPMVIIEPIPGQEESNADYLAAVGAAISIRLPEHVAFAVTQLLDDAPRLQQIREIATRAARPSAATGYCRSDSDRYRRASLSATTVSVGTRSTQSSSRHRRYARDRRP